MKKCKKKPCVYVFVRVGLRFYIPQSYTLGHPTVTSANVATFTCRKRYMPGQTITVGEELEQPLNHHGKRSLLFLRI